MSCITICTVILYKQLKYAQYTGLTRNCKIKRSIDDQILFENGVKISAVFIFNQILNDRK